MLGPYQQISTCLQDSFDPKFDDQKELMAGIDDSGRLVSVKPGITSYFYTSSDVKKFTQNLSQLIEEAGTVANELKLDQRTIEAISVKNTGYLSLQELKADVADFLKTAACQIVRTRERLQKTTSSLSSEGVVDDIMCQWIRKELHEGFSRYNSDRQVEDIKTLIPEYIQGLGSWQAETVKQLHQRAENDPGFDLEGSLTRLNDTVKQFTEECTQAAKGKGTKKQIPTSVEETTKASRKEDPDEFATPQSSLNESMVTSLQAAEPESLPGSMEASPTEKDNWRFYGSQAEDLRRLDAQLRSGDPDALEQLVTELQQPTDISHNFLFNREAELAEQLTQYPELVCRLVLSGQEPLSHFIDILNSSKELPGKADAALFRAFRDVVKETPNPLMQSGNQDQYALALLVRHSDSLRHCRPEHIQQMAFLVQRSGDAEEYCVSTLAEHYQEQPQGLFFYPLMTTRSACINPALFTEEDNILAGFIKQYPASIEHLPVPIFKRLLKYPDLSTHWPKCLMASSEKLGQEHWQVLTSGAPPALHEILESQLSSEPPQVMVVDDCATSCVEAFLDSHPLQCIQLLQKPRSKTVTYKYVTPPKTISDIAHQLPLHKKLNLAIQPQGWTMVPTLAEELASFTTPQKPATFSMELMSFICHYPNSLSVDDLSALFQHMQAPYPVLTTEQQRYLVEAFNSNPGVLEKMACCMDFNALLCDPWQPLPAPATASAQKQIYSLALMAIDQQPLPTMPERLEDKPESRLNLTIWYRKHRHILFRSCQQYTGKTAIPKSITSGQPTDNLNRVILQQMKLVDKTKHPGEAVSNLLSCVFDDEHLTQLMQHKNCPLQKLTTADVVFIATHRGPLVAKKMLQKFPSLPGFAVAEIGRKHPGLLKAAQWERLDRKSLLALAPTHPDIAEKLRADASLPERAWLECHCQPHKFTVFEQWKRESQNPFTRADKEQWILVLQQMCSHPEAQAMLLDEGFPWPVQDQDIKGNVMLKLLGQQAGCLTPEILESIVSVKLKRIMVQKELASILAEHYAALKDTQVLTNSMISSLSDLTISRIVEQSEVAALDFWHRTKHEDSLRKIASQSLDVSRAILESLQSSVDQSTIHMPVAGRLEILRHSPHPEIKRRLSFMELNGQLATSNAREELTEELDHMVEIHPHLQLVKDEPELFKYLLSMVETGYGTPQGLIEDLKDCGEDSLRIMLTPDREDKHMQSLGFRTLMATTGSADKLARSERDQIIAGATKFEAIAKRVLKSTEPHMAAFRDSLTEKQKHTLIAPHSHLCLSVMASGQPATDDKTRIHWAVWHERVAKALLLDPQACLQNPDSLTGKDLEKMLTRSGSNCQLVLTSAALQPMRDKLTPESWIEIAGKQPELARQLIKHPNLVQELKLTSEHMLSIAANNEVLLKQVLGDAAHKPFLDSMAKEQWLEKAKSMKATAGLVMAKGLELGHIDEHDCLVLADESTAIRTSLQQYLPPAVSGKIAAEHKKTTTSATDLPSEFKPSSYPGNLIKFSQGRDFANDEIGGGCCAGFAIDFCLHCADPMKVPEQYIFERDRWQKNKDIDPYLRKVRHYQYHQDVFADSRNPTVINLDGKPLANSDPEASIIHLDGKRRLDMDALIREVRQHKGIYITSVGHAIALTCRPGYFGDGDTLYLLDANNGLYRFDNFVGDPDQLDDVEAVINNWLMVTGRGELDVKMFHLQKDAFDTTYPGN